MAGSDPISTVHLAIEPLLRPWFPKDRWAIDAVPVPLSIEEFRRLTTASPWIGIGWRSWKPQQTTGRSLVGRHELQVTFFVKNARGRATRFFGDRLGPGLYPALVTAAGALHGRSILGEGTLEVMNVVQSFADGYSDIGSAVGVIELSFLNKLIPDLGEPAEAPDFTKLVSSFELDPAVEGAQSVDDTIDLPGASAP